MMNSIKVVKRLLIALLGPDSVNRIIGKYYEMEILLKYWSVPIYKESVEKLRVFKNKHRGERCFIIGNGPSLKQMDLSPLKNEITFGLNRIYLLFEHLGFSATYFVSVNQYVIEQCAAEIENLACPKFISWDARDYIQFSSDMIFIKSRNGPKFCYDISTQGVWVGTTVTYVAMQLAYHMGFSEVILIGVDHNFQTKGEPHKLVISQGEDPNHFDPNYFGKGFKWQLPDLKTSEDAYRLAREAFESDGRRIVDATVSGKLKVFPKVKYGEIVTSSS